MAEKPKAATVTLLCCVSSDGAATWPQTVARDDAAVETCEPDSLMKKLDEFKEQPVCVLLFARQLRICWAPLVL